MGPTTETREDGEAKGTAYGANGFDADGYEIPTVRRRLRLPIVQESNEPPNHTLDHAFHSIGGRKAAIRLAEQIAVSDERVGGVVGMYRMLTAKRRANEPRLLERLCIENKIDPSEFLGLCAGMAHRNQLNAASLLAASHLEDIVEAGAQMAKQPEGVADRKLFYEHSTFIPVRGPGVAIQVNQGNNSGSAALPEFRSLAEIALQAVSRAALPPSNEEEGAIDGEIIERTRS